MKKFTNLFVVSILLFSACQEDKIGNQLLGNNGESSSIEVKDGFLNFSNDEVFETYIKSLGKSENRSFNSKEFKGFRSIAQLDESKSSNLRSLNKDEEMTQDEFNLMKAKKLIPDPILTQVLDTTLRIRVSDRIYKITEKGTFSANISDSAYLKDKILNFNLSEEKESNGLVDLGNGVTFISSFKNETVFLSKVDSLNMNRSLCNCSRCVRFYDKYNVESYEWKSNSRCENFWEKLRGKNISKSNNFNSDKRVIVNVYNVNYGFYASSGISVKMQKCKRYLCFKYWVSDKADKLAIGFDKLYGVLSLKNPILNTELNPINSTLTNSLECRVRGREYNFIYGICDNLDGIKGWTSNVVSYLPKVDSIGRAYPNDDTRDAVYDCPTSCMFTRLKSQTGKYFYKNVEKEIQPNDPKVMYLVRGDTPFEYNKKKSFLTGLKEYANESSKTIEFDKSFGFSHNSGRFNVTVPSEFKIKVIDAFGSAYYDGAWKGIRFFYDENE